MNTGAPNPSSAGEWRQGQVVDVAIADLSSDGSGVGRRGQRVVFVPDTVPGDRAQVRLMRVKPQYAHAKLLQLLAASPHRVQPACPVADRCGGCQWQPVDYHLQLAAKRQQVVQALTRIGGLSHLRVDPALAASPLAYRNKATYPLGSTSAAVQSGYYEKGTHCLVDLNDCPIQDPRLDPLLAGVKQDIQQRGWQVYDEQRHRGQVRHLALRIGRRTGDMLLTLVVRDWDLPGLADQAQAWLARYPNLVGVCLNRNPGRTGVTFGPETRCVAGQPHLNEIFAGLQFLIRPETFFQIYTEQAEALLEVVLQQLDLQGNETVVDAYCGVGTLTLPLAQRVRQAIGLEAQPAAVVQARDNAALNQIHNVSFQVGAVEALLPTLETIDVVLLDPPRKGCAPAVLESLTQRQPAKVVYISCSPTTLARDLKRLCQGGYDLTRVQPADFFPQTAHVEAAAFLVHQSQRR